RWPRATSRETSGKRTARAGQLPPTRARPRPAKSCPSIRHRRRQNRRWPRATSRKTSRKRTAKARRLWPTRRDGDRQAAAQASGIAGAKTEGARDRSQEKGRQRQGKFRQQRQLRRGLARDGRLGPAIGSRAHGELNRRRAPALILESMLLLLPVREG